MLDGSNRGTRLGHYIPDQISVAGWNLLLTGGKLADLKIAVTDVNTNVTGTVLVHSCYVYNSYFYAPDIAKGAVSFPKAGLHSLTFVCLNQMLCNLHTMPNSKTNKKQSKLCSFTNGKNC